MRLGIAMLGLLAAITAPAAAQQHEHDESAVHSRRGPGPHFIDALFTENAFMERKVRPDVFFLKGTEGEVYRAQLEVEWAVVRNVSLILHAPVLHMSPELGSSETGIGDISVGAKFAPINNRETFILAIGADLEIPTGDEDRGLGAGHAGAEPFLLTWLPFGSERRWLFQTATHLAIPFESAEDVGAEITAALSWTSPLGVTPLVEGLTEFALEGDFDPSWWVAPGFRWEFAPEWELGGSVLIPITGPEADEQDFAVKFGFIRHFPLPR